MAFYQVRAFDSACIGTDEFDCLEDALESFLFNVNSVRELAQVHLIFNRDDVLAEVAE